RGFSIYSLIAGGHSHALWSERLSRPRTDVQQAAMLLHGAVAEGKPQQILSALPVPGESRHWAGRPPRPAPLAPPARRSGRSSGEATTSDATRKGQLTRHFLMLWNDSCRNQ